LNNIRLNELNENNLLRYATAMWFYFSKLSTAATLTALEKCDGADGASCGKKKFSPVPAHYWKGGLSERMITIPRSFPARATRVSLARALQIAV